MTAESECEEYKEIMNIKNEEIKLVETKAFIKIYEPEGEIISRSGSKCVVSLLDQWYIDYSLPEWLEDGIEWIYKWGFSRSFGLGPAISDRFAERLHHLPCAVHV